MSDATSFLFTSTLTRIGLLQTVGKGLCRNDVIQASNTLEQIFEVFFLSAYESDSNDGSVNYKSLILRGFERGMFL